MFWRKKKDPQEDLRGALAMAEEQMKDMLPRIGQLSPQEQQELKALMAAAGIAGSALRAAQTIKDADAFGDRMHDQTMKMIEQARAMTSGQKAPPAADPQQLIDACKRMQDALNGSNGTAKAKTDEALWLKSGCPATADIKVGPPLKLKHKP